MPTFPVCVSHIQVSAVQSRKVRGCWAGGQESRSPETGLRYLLTIALGGGQGLGVLEKFEVPFPSHACGAEKILDDEHRNRFVHRDYEGAFDVRLRVDEVVAALPVKGESSCAKTLMSVW